MLTTRAQLHDLIDRLPDYAFGGAHGPAAQPPEEIIRALRDLTDMTKALFAVARQMADGGVRFGPSHELLS